MVTLQPDGKLVVQRDQLPFRQRASEQVKSRPLKAVVLILNQLDLNPPTAAVPIRLFLWGGAPPMSFGAYHVESSM